MTDTLTPARPVEATPAVIQHEYGPFADGGRVHGVSFDGEHVWAATGTELLAVDPASGTVERRLAVASDAGTAFDGTHLWQIADGRIQRVDPATGAVLGSIPAPAEGCSGMAWAEGSLWVGEYRGRRIHRVDPATGDVLRTLASDRFVTGVTWDDGALWHGTWEDDRSELRRVDATDGTVEQRVAMPDGMGVSGLEADGTGRFWCGGGGSGRLRVVQRPPRA